MIARMPRIVAVQAPAGFGKTTLLRSTGLPYVVLFPGEGTPERLALLLHSALLGEKPPPAPPFLLFRDLLDRLPDTFSLALDDAHHLTPQAADFLQPLLERPGARVYVAGRDLSALRFLPRLLARGEAELLEAEELARRLGVCPRHLREEVRRRLQALPSSELQALVSLAGHPFWREDLLKRRGLSPEVLVRDHGLPLQRKESVFFPHEFLQEALLERASSEDLLANALFLEKEAPHLAAPLYLRAGHPQAVVRLALDQAERWLLESRFQEVVSWLSGVPHEALSPLRGLLALAYLETGRTEEALALARTQEDALSLITSAIHALRIGRYRAASRLAERALARPGPFPVPTRLLAERVRLTALLSLDPGRREELKGELLRLLEEASPYPAQELAVRSLYLFAFPEGGLRQAVEGFHRSMELGYPNRAVAFLQAASEAALGELFLGRPQPAVQVLSLAEELLAAGRAGAGFVIPFTQCLRAQILALQDRLEEALAAIEEGRREARERSLTDAWRGLSELGVEVLIALARQGRVQALAQARALVEEMEAEASASGKPAPHLHRGLVFLLEGRLPEAFRELEQAASLEGANAFVALALLGRALPGNPPPYAQASLHLLGLSFVPRVLSVRDRTAYTPHPVSLSVLEVRLLLALLPGPASPQELAHLLYGEESRIGAIYTALSRLRKKGVHLRKEGGRYVLEGYRLDLHLLLENARFFPHLLLPFAQPGLSALLPYQDPFIEDLRDELLETAKGLVLEHASRGAVLPWAALLDPEDPHYRSALAGGVLAL